MINDGTLSVIQLITVVIADPRSGFYNRLHRQGHCRVISMLVSYCTNKAKV